MVKSLIDNEFPMLKDKYSAGLIGYGSDVLENDDELSRDHEWGVYSNRYRMAMYS